MRVPGIWLPSRKDERHTKSAPRASSVQPSIHDQEEGAYSSDALIPNATVPPVNSYGSIGKTKGLSRRASHLSFATSASETPSLQPQNAGNAIDHRWEWEQEISSDVIPFMATIMSLRRTIFGGQPKTTFDPRLSANVPLAIIALLTEYLSELEARGVVPGTTMGSMIGTMQSFEDSLTGLERILTTPLPYIYSVHIRYACPPKPDAPILIFAFPQTVRILTFVGQRSLYISAIWIYLFFLPLQLLEGFGWYAVPGTLIAAFFYLGTSDTNSIVVFAHTVPQDSSPQETK
jgi:hypothetical protein